MPPIVVFSIVVFSIAIAANIGSILLRLHRVKLSSALKTGLVSQAADSSSDGFQVQGRFRTSPADLLFAGGAMVVEHHCLVLVPSKSRRFRVDLEDIDRLVLRTFAHWRRLDIYMRGDAQLDASFRPDDADFAERALVAHGFPLERRTRPYW